MNVDWLIAGRKIPDDVMYFIRRMAVNAIRVLGQSPEKIAEAYNFDRSCIYRWLKQYDEGGFEALESKMPPGAEPLITRANCKIPVPAEISSRQGPQHPNFLSERRFLVVDYHVI